MFYSAITLLMGISLLTGCKQENKTKSVSPIKVQVKNITPTTVDGAQKYSGTVEESTGTALSFTTGGTIKTVYVSTGQMVSKGAILAEVDETSLRNAYEAALATRQQAEDAYSRMKQLHDNNSLPEIQWMDVQSKLKQAIAAEQIARKGLSDCKLYAPFSGYISDKFVETGQNVLPGSPVLKLVNIDKVKVKMSIPENEISKINSGKTVWIQIAALDNKQYEGKITETGVTANPLSRAYEVKATIENQQREILPGMVCNILLDNDSANTAIILPNNAVSLDNQNKSFVWISSNGKAHKRAVQTGDLVPEGIIITKGLSTGESVIVEGQQKVSEGSPITL